MRYLPHTPEEIGSMLKTIGVKTIDEVFAGIPAQDRLDRALKIPAALAEPELRRQLRHLADQNISASEAKSFIGAGAYQHEVPAVIDPIIKRGEFLTAYTPYQPEVSQGTLQAVFEFQTMMSELTGMEISNASMYDLSTGCAEALLMAQRVTGRNKALVAQTLHPHIRQVIATYLKNINYEVVEIPYLRSGRVDTAFIKSHLADDLAAVLIPSPNFFGVIEDLQEIRKLITDENTFFITANPEPISYSVLPSPGECGADIAVAEGMSFGLGLNFGGPYLGIFTTREKYIRQMPGRLVGETVDEDGKRGYVLTFATREQHIRREKATSNICTNQGLCALAASVYLSLHGPQGLEKLALLNMSRLKHFEELVRKRNPDAVVFTAPRFHETVIKLKVPAMDAVVEILKDGFFAGLDLSTYYPELENHLLVCTTEVHSTFDIEVLVEKLSRFL